MTPSAPPSPTPCTAVPGSRRGARSAVAALLFALLATLATPPARADEVLVAVAANFAEPLQALAPGFRAATGHQLKVSSGATQRFAGQVAAGAPYQVLLAADQATPQRLVAEGYALADSRFTYATGRLVLWSAQPGLVDDQGAVLAAEGRWQRLALANPQLAPYGAAAMQVLAARGLLERVRPRLVTGQNVGQAWQFVASGNAELGFVALSQVSGKAGQGATGSRWLVPATLHEPLRQDAVLLRAGEGRPAAQALLDYLRTPQARQLMRTYGYE